MRNILLIDGENFIHKVEDIIKEKNKSISSSVIASMDYSKLFKDLLGIHINKKIFYAAKLHHYPETKKQSERLIKFQRKLRNKLVNQGFEFIISGHVRGQKTNGKILFKEKGVDVRIAVDMVSMGCDKKVDTIYLCSSDSDLQPAIKEVRKRNIKVIYVGFALNPNKGLIATTHKTLLFKNADILKLIDKNIK